MRKINHQQKGFGIIEVLISSLIIAIMLGGSISLGNISVNRVINAQNRLVAYNLANEAIENIIAIRNRAYIDGNPATGAFLTDGNFTSSDAGLLNVDGKLKFNLHDDYQNIYFTDRNPMIETDTTGAGELFYYPMFDQDESFPKIKITSSTNSMIFTRKISQTIVASNPSLINRTGVKISVEVSWTEVGSTARDANKIVQSIILTDWQSGQN